MITVKQLSQLKYLKQEICVERERIAKLRSLAQYGAYVMDGMPHSTDISDRTGRYASEILYLEDLLAEHMHRGICELLRLQEFINGIEDCEIRLIFFFRYVKCLSWTAVAFRLGMHDEQIPRKRHDRFINLQCE